MKTPRDNTMRHGALALIPVGILGLALLVPGEDSTMSTSPSHSETSSQETHRADDAPSVTYRGDRAHAMHRGGEREASILDGVEFSVDSICVRQAVVASVIGGADFDEDLAVFVAGERGSSAVVRAYVPGPFTVKAFAYDTRGRLHEASGTIEARDCPDAPRVELSQQFSSSREDAVTFNAQVIQGLEEPIDWEWSFGDGTTRGGDAEELHSYRMRPQRDKTSTFVVTAKGTDHRGVTAKGHARVVLTNGEWILSQHGQWKQPVEFDRFAKIEDGELFSPVQIRNIRADQGMSLTNVVVKETGCGSSGEVREYELAPNDVLGVEEIGADEVVSLDLSLPDVQRGACRWTVSVEGTFDDGTPSEVYLGFEHAAPSWVSAARDREAIKRAFERRLLDRARHIPTEAL